jgi:imidazole glycerol-phosphate synthase subunit HisH
VVPGVGAAAPAMARLAAGDLVAPIVDRIAADLPVLGICLGLQLLFEGSDEDGAETLGVIAGRTVRLPDAPTLPHIGWNQVERRRDASRVQRDRSRR